MLVLIKGAGDLATGVAVRLYRAGLWVVMTELDRPTAVRRTVAFSQCVYDGTAIVEGITARLCGVDEVADTLARREIPVLTVSAEELLRQFPFDAVVDAMLAKRNTGTSIDDAAQVIALGAGFTAGVDCHAVVETMRGHDLGRVIVRGGVRSDAGGYGEVGSYASERRLRAPCDGIFRPLREIGTTVRTGEIVAVVDGQPVTAQMDGVLRGILPDGLPVTAGMKAGDIDPHCTRAHCFTVSDRARAVGGGVLEALCRPAAPPLSDGLDRLILCGGGHISLALARLAATLDFSVTVIDDRPEFASRARFPMAAQLLALPFDEALDAVSPGAGDYVCVLTRGHAFDSVCAARVLPLGCAYVGVIGSRRKTALLREGLLQAGHAAETVAGMHAPIGLDISAETPEEIAVSIAAQLIQVRAARGGGRAVLPDGPGVEVRIITKTGSAPRGVGAAMLVRPDGGIAGTVGGGRVEHMAIQEARALLDAGGGTRERTYDLSGAHLDPGMVCGGKVTLQFRTRGTE